MTPISSEPAHNAATLNDEVTLALRAITEKRAATIGYLLDESRQRQIADDFAREAIRHYGRDLGHKIRAQMEDKRDLQEFAGLFTRGLESQVYEMEPVSIGRAEFIVLFHYCPYVNCWRQQGRGASDIATLCDICMEGDHALTDAFPGLHLEVQTALARGDASCRLRFYQAEEREGE
ncbi:L-2-amino-thiazoline-4-carboxylic acid hydrolase [Klebsiella grimontii]|uniref:L-2-amino-thiazoline-4-carboxylic acid hydrolase n=1 Tax=Klebsiella grimontii TaxID=2058152 RepID=UPI002243B7D8|nr:L-2-amino-thiazoline-4-carboxylic acid hydrolase [Klebsiella grimontii]